MYNLLILSLLGEVLYPQLKMKASFTEDRSTFYSREVFFIRVVLYNSADTTVLFPAELFLEGRIAPAGGPIHLSITKNGKPVEQTIRVDFLRYGPPPSPRDTALLKPGDSLVTFITPLKGLRGHLVGYDVTEPGTYVLERIKIQRDMERIPWVEDSICLVFKIEEAPDGVQEEFNGIIGSRKNPEGAAGFIKKHPNHPLVTGAVAMASYYQLYEYDPELLLSCAARFPDFFLLGEAYTELARYVGAQMGWRVDPAFMARLDSVLLANIYFRPYGEEILRWKEKRLGWKIGEKFKQGGK